MHIRLNTTMHSLLSKIVKVLSRPDINDFSKFDSYYINRIPI